ncbi:PhzF family phenazine biosynthesis protein [Aeromicrobium sp. 9AM]|uniref:PhzF family phenazine biosynthesis protein n=1 Tax=Aeromicrobium sp. 9AM TaxID=2653126 RepID=UPI0012F187F9|nr:PhzF family phenazine biosynthesis protein [Aeromicrobium sp. 9AM]VXB21392.1 Phenazine biosynthesis protein PhzF [Aeromicrobium sp. 9AM]
MHPFSQIDVFASTITEGNPLAVVHDADDLTDEQMAAFARWTNLAETTFLLRPSSDADYRVRIFNTQRELPFAGHPTLGSARAWLEAGGTPRTPGAIVQECGAGLIRIRQDGDRLAFAAPPLIRDGAVDDADLKRVIDGLGVEPARVVDAKWADNGPGWVAVLLDSAETVLNLKPDQALFGENNRVGVVGPHPEGSETAVEIRAFTSSPGGEDPATGSLNASIAQWLIGTGRAPSSYVAAQGTAVRRRGRIHVDQVGEDIWIGGETVVGISGTVDL